MYDYFFVGAEYIRVSRGDVGPGAIDPGYPAPVSNWGWGAFGADWIDAALYSGSKCYFFSGDQYIRVTRGETGPGVVDPGYPAPISNWGWGAFGADGIDAALYSGSVCYFFSGDQYIRAHRADSGAGLVDRNYPAPISNWGWGTFGADGIDAALYSGGPLVPANLDTLLVSNHNYFLENGGQSMTDVAVTLHFDSDLISTANGFSIQLNAYSGPGDFDAWQQIWVFKTPGDNALTARIENWVNTSTELVNIQEKLADLPGGKIPVGYELTIALQTDSADNVSGATFTLTDENGHDAGTVDFAILGHPLSTTNQPATVADLAPITAIQLNIGGDFSGHRATLTAGAGTVTYSAAAALSAVNEAPTFIDQDIFTLENANLAFGQLPVAAHVAMSQSFRLTPPGPDTPDALARAAESASPHGHRSPPPRDMADAGSA